MKDSTRRRYEALTPAQRQSVEAILRPEIERGWIPRRADIEAAITLALAAETPGSARPVESRRDEP